jgi:hypothetical protein
MRSGHPKLSAKYGNESIRISEVKEIGTTEPYGCRLPTSSRQAITRDQLAGLSPSVLKPKQRPGQSNLGGNRHREQAAKLVACKRASEVRTHSRKGRGLVIVLRFGVTTMRPHKGINSSGAV